MIGRNVIIKLHIKSHSTTLCALHLSNMRATGDTMSNDLETTMELPHRRHAYGVNAPALVRHVGFRITERGDSPLAAVDFHSTVNLREKIIDKINIELVRIQERCESTQTYTFCKMDEKPTDLQFGLLHTFFNALPTLPGTLSSWRARIRVDISVEFYFVTFILDQKTTRNSQTEIALIERQLTDGTFHNAKEFIEKYYEEVWNQFDAFIGDWQKQLPGHSFAEFRGTAFRDLDSPFRQDVQSDKADEAFKIPQLDPDRVENSRNLLRRWLGRNQDFISEIMQLKTASGAIDRDANSILCELLDGAAIYCSATRQAYDRAAGGKRPLRYFILYTGLSKYQLGRLIRRAHVLGEYRCGAVLDLDKIERAGARIRALGNRISKLLLGKPASATLDDAELRSVQNDLNELAYSDVNGGLLYRINRSRYYAAIFRSAIKDMRPRKLEGWQTYEEFFRRNLYSHFDEIDQIGQRYEALAERINRLTHARNTEKLNDFQTTMIRIQRLGEIIGLAAFTYYGGHILATVFPILSKWICATGWYCPVSLDIEDRHWMEFFGMLTAFLLALGLYRWWSHRPGHQGPGKSSAVRPAIR
jgi:hypothetical protein